jgi:hypothetical protein
MNSFAEGLLSAGGPPPKGLMLPGGGDVGRRFAIYRNNVAVALGEALAMNFPAVASLVGQPFMAAMARDYFRVAPPQSPVLASWGEGFADWLEGYDPVAGLPYLADVARLEHLARQSINAADAATAEPRAWAAAGADVFAQWWPRLHPATRWLVTSHPVLFIRARALDQVPPQEAETGEVLLTRPGLDLALAVAPPGTAQVLTRLAGGATVAEALAPVEAAGAILHLLLTQGALGQEGEG